MVKVNGERERDLQKIEGRKSHSEKQQILVQVHYTKQQTDQKVQNYLKKKMDYQKQKKKLYPKPRRRSTTDHMLNNDEANLHSINIRKNTNLTKEDSCQK